MKTTLLLFFILFINIQVFAPITSQGGTSESPPLYTTNGSSSVNSINQTSSNSNNSLKILLQKAQLNYKTLKSETSNITDPTLFISKWNTAINSSQSSNSTQVKLPLLADGNYNFSVNWGDGTNSTITIFNQSDVTHNYTTAGIYTITINGTLQGWAFHNEGDKLKILDINQWGNMQLGNSGGYFSGCIYLVITALDTPNLNGTTSLVDAFKNCNNLISLGQNANWNVSAITNMSGMFAYDYVFDQSIQNWNVSNVQDMSSMFYFATAFNEPLNLWNVSKVTSMFQMFDNANNFNGAINKWDVSHVTNMSFMFYMDNQFSGHLNSWNVSNVNDMSHMFARSGFDEPVDQWNVSNVIDMSYMFDRTDFDQPINQWQVSNVKNMVGMLFTYEYYNSTYYDNLLIAWAKLHLQFNVELDVGTTYTNSSVNARNFIIKTFGWKIHDDGISKKIVSNQIAVSDSSSPAVSVLDYNNVFIFIVILIGIFLGFSFVTFSFYNYYKKEYNSSSNEKSKASFIDFLPHRLKEKKVRRPFEKFTNILKVNHERKQANNLRKEILRGNFENIDQLVEAKQLGAKSFQELQLVKQLHAPDYLTATKILSGKFQDMEQYQTALDLGAKTLWGMHLVEKFHAPDYKTAIKIRAGNFEDMEQYSIALAVGAKNLQELQLVEKYQAPDYITATKILAGDFEDMDHYSKALTLGAKNLQELQLVEKAHAPDYKTAIKIFAGNFADIDQYSHALAVGAKNLQELQLVEKLHAPDYITAIKINTGNFVDLEQYTIAKSLGANTLEELTLVESTKAPNYTLANKVKNFGFSNYEIYKKATTNGFFDKESWELFQKRLQKLTDNINNRVDVLREDFKRELDISDTDKLLTLLDNLNVPLQGSYILFSNFKTEIDVSSLIKDISSNKLKKLFTEYEFKDKIPSNQQVENCKICFKPLIGLIGYCPFCLNEAHYNCLTNWVLERHSCPMCRHNLEIRYLIQLEKGKLSVCLLCKKLFIKNEKIIRCEECLSTYHKAEFLEWVKVKGSCPNCNQKINF